MEWTYLYIPKYWDRQAFKIANNVDPDKMLQNPVSHLGVHC